MAARRSAADLSRAVLVLCLLSLVKCGVIHGGGGYGGIEADQHIYGTGGGHHGLEILQLSGGGLYHGGSLLALGGGHHAFPGQPELIDIGPVGQASVQVIQGSVPSPKTVTITKTVAVGVPVPFPVRHDVAIPVHVTHPVPVPVAVQQPQLHAAPAGLIAQYTAQGYGASGGGGSYGAGDSYGGGSYYGGSGADLGAAAALAFTQGTGHGAGAVQEGGSHEQTSAASNEALVGEETIQRAISAAEAIEEEAASKTNHGEHHD